MSEVIPIKGVLTAAEAAYWARFDTHRSGDCHLRERRVVHAPSDHPMRVFPLNYRADREMTERVCPHGVGHPDPDQDLSDAQGVHGCDGCCTGAYGTTVVPVVDSGLPTTPVVDSNESGGA